MEKFNEILKQIPNLTPKPSDIGLKNNNKKEKQISEQEGLAYIYIVGFKFSSCKIFTWLK